MINIKRKSTKLVSLFMVFIIISYTMVAEAHKFNNEFSIGNEIGYKVEVGDNNWNNFITRTECIKALYIPALDAESISTSEIIDLMLAYPLLDEIILHDDLSEAIKALEDMFPGISVIKSRNNALEEIIKVYNDYVIPEKYIIEFPDVDSENYVEEFNKIISDKENLPMLYKHVNIRCGLLLLEMLMLDIAGNDKQKIDMVYDAFMNKLDEKERSEYYIQESSMKLINYAIDVNSQFVEKVFNDKDMLKATTKVFTTPDGKSLSYSYSNTLSMCPTDSYAALISENNASLVSRASTTFNCFSFAWLQDLYPDDYQHIWLNNQGPFFNDSHYTHSKTASVGSISSTSKHASIVLSLNRLNKKNYKYEPYVWSKWGSGPIVAHCETAHPFYSGEVSDYYKKK